MSTPQQTPPGRGRLGWLGRQVGHVARAIRTDVTAPVPAVVHRAQDVREQPHPSAPNVVLRRTIVDEVIVVPPPLPGGTPKD